MTGSSLPDFLRARLNEESAFASHNWEDLAQALSDQAALISDPAEKAGLICRAGAAAARAQNYDRALELFSQVKDHPLWETLARLHRLELHWIRGDWQQLAAVIEEESRDQKLWKENELRLEKARVLAFRLGLVEEALKEIALILAQDPGCREAIWLKLVLALRSGDWDRATADYQKLFELAAGDHDSPFCESCALRLAQIHEFRYRKRAEAKTWYEKIDAGAEPLLVRTALFELAEAEKDWGQAAAQLAELIAVLEASDPGSLATQKLLHVRILEDALDKPEEADRELADLVEKFPDDFGALYLGAERAMETGPADRRAELAGRMASKLTDPREIAYFLSDRVRLLLEDLGDYEAAIAAARAWMQAVPEDPSARRWLVEALHRAGKFQETIAEIDGVLQNTNDPRERQGLLFEKAEIATHNLASPAIALEAYRAALEIPPSQFTILKAMARLYHLQKDYKNLAPVITAAMKLVQDPLVRKFYQNWLASLFLERLGREDQAFAMFGELMKSDPGDRTALKVIARISRKKGAWNNFLGALSRIADSTPDPALKLELQARMAWLFEVKLDQKDRALPLYQALATQPFARESLRRLYYRDFEVAAYAEVLQSGIEAMPQSLFRAARLCRLASAREIRGELAEAWAAYEKARVSLIQQPHLFLPMIDLAQLSGYWGRYLNLLEEFAQRLSDPFKKALLWEAAWSRSEIPGPTGGIDAEALLRAMKNLDEATGGSSAALRGAFLASLWTGDHRGRAELLARMIKMVPEEASAPLRLRLAAVLGEDLGAREEGIAALRQVLARDPQSLPLIRELELIYEEAQQWGELIRMLLMEVPLRKEPELQVEIYGRLAKLYEEKFQALDEAIKCHQAVLRLAPDRLPNHQERARLLEVRSRWADLERALLEFEAVTPEVNDKIALRVRAAVVCDEKLHDPTRAIAHLSAALDLNPSRLDTFDFLVKIYERENRWQELVQVLLGHTERVTAPAEKAELHERVAAIQEGRLGNPPAAIEHLIVARDLDPARRSVLLTLERLFTAASRWEELIDTFERLAQSAGAPDQITYFSRIGSLWDVNLGKLPEAIQSWERVRGLDNRNVPAFEALVSLYERTGDDPALVERAVALAELVADDQPRAVDLLCKSGSILETRLHDDTQALALYHRGMEIDPRSLPPLAAAKAVYERREDWPPAIQLWLREEEISDAIARKLEIFTAVGGLYESRLHDDNSAAGAYENALSLSGDYLPAVTPLSEIYFQQGAWEKARPLFEIRTAAASGEALDFQAQVWDKAGWCQEQMGDVSAAMSRYHSAVAAVADSRHPLERLSELYTKQEKWEEAAGFTDRLLLVVREASDHEATFVFLNRKGGIEDKRGKLEVAAQAYEQALAIKPGNYDALSRLVDLYLRLHEWRKALGIYDLLIKNSPSLDAAANGLVGKGEVLEDRLAEEESALAHFRKASEIVPTHLVAWTRLSAIYLRRSAWPEAEQALTKLLQLEKDKPKLVEHHHNLGHVYFVGLTDLPHARDQFEAALAMDPVHVPSMQSLGDIYLKLEEWEKFVTTAEKFVRMVPAEGQHSLIPTYQKLGEVYRDHLKNTERAVIHFQAAIKLDPESKEARAELATLYLSDPKFIDQAKAENRSLIRLQPFRVQSYRDLAEIYKSQHNLDAMFYIYSILHLFDALDLEEQMFYEANLDKIPKKGRQTLKEIEREGQLIHPDERGPLRDLILNMGDALDKVLPAPLDKYGAKKSNRLPDDSTAPINGLALEIQTALGLESFAIYLVPQAVEPQVMHSTPPALVISNDWLSKFNEAEQRFVMGRFVEHMINRHGFALHYPVDQLAKTLCLLAMGAEPAVQFAIPGLAADEAEKQKKKLAKLISRKFKTQIEHAAQRFNADLLNSDFNKWRKAMDHTANRAGLLVCGDLTAACTAILKADPQYHNQRSWAVKDLMPLWEKNKDVIELLTFAVSDPFFRLRQRLGFSIT